MLVRYFYDCEFIEDGTTIELVSIGVVAEDGREFYAVSTEFDPGKAGPWVRANVLDTAKGGYRPEVHVKAIGSADKDFRGGDTDLRGLFIADGLRGKATVIAREGESRYAFFRGDTWLGTPENAPAAPAEQMFRQQMDIDYQGNLNVDNGMIQQLNNDKFNSYRRQAPNKGVQMKAAY